MTAASVGGLTLSLRDRTLELGSRPLLMGVLNATPDSFSDGGDYATLDARVARAAELIEQGADIIDIGGESNVTNRPAVDAAEEIERVVPLIERVVAELGATVSVDTYKPAVAQAAVAAGAHMVNDISGLADARLADICAASGAALVIMHTPVAPKSQSHDENRYGEEIAGCVATFLAERSGVAHDHGVKAEQILLDPGPDFGKTPAQTVAVLRDLHVIRGARPAAPARHLAQGLHRRDHEPPATRPACRDAGGARGDGGPWWPHIPPARHRPGARLPCRARGAARRRAGRSGAARGGRGAPRSACRLRGR